RACSNKALTLATLALAVSIEALLEQARNDEKRALALREINEEYLADTMMDQYKFNRMSLEAQLEIAEASVEQAQANLDNSEVNLGYTIIESPCDGIVIDRKIDEGQTLAAQFTAPELFVVAPDMEKEMYVYASVGEPDIGEIRAAVKRRQPVEFTVDAYQEDLFKGTVYQIRMNPTTVQNVVTYPVVIKAPNPDLKLMPGMTANISFRVEERKDVVRIPNEALRFFPKPSQVREEDKEILEGKTDEKKEEEDESGVVKSRSAADVAAAGKKRHHRHVWVVDGDFLRAIEITLGVIGNNFSELIEGDIEPGRKLVSGVEK
ncbi:MAG: efflux RND transporter periplasmic adaptor subunit, partial [Planctomycetota bacterium]|nr:efflux RND transporter periplasmic adaptor subunit [Planctomycetota bacterium]